MTDAWRWKAVVGSACALMVCACDGSSDGTEPRPPVTEPTPPPFRLQPEFPNLTFISPVAMLQAPGDTSRWFIVEQAGEVRVFENNPAVMVGSPFVDITDRVASGGELGLLGMAFHPNFPGDPRVYLSYTHNDASLGLVSRISEFTTPDMGLTLDPNSEQLLLTIKQPESNHNGGGIAFGPDDLLYVGMGDGGGGNDGGTNNTHGPIGNGQSLTTLLGKFLRIDVEGTTGGFRYRIPVDNPFEGNPLCGMDGTGLQECPEIFAWGFRNPWRWSFDRQSGELWVGDVGQSAIEEVSRVVLGGNYGWRCFEGTRDTGLDCGTPQNPQAPVAEYGRNAGTTVTGGYVYRGAAIPSLRGEYVFGDFGSGRIWSIAGDTQPTLTVINGDSLESGLSISSFAEDNDGELYVVHYGGTVHRVMSR
jgi:glucose/arabinose dehydrogenase